ncbi:MAG TPA: HesA/MoeB/ThiF family protein [Candidatus Ozemobacteraceae bacterium]|nr:HesA/MoeB/ThiF family protein [Candidatus Ozemobacteraceae bacterium]
MDRYDRHRPLFGEAAFARLRRSRILVAGAGGLGSTVLQLLARGGFGEIYIYDDAVVDPPDLNRQLLYGTRHLGRGKAEAAREVLGEINPDVFIHGVPERITASTVLPEVDLVVDALDTFEARFVLDDLCHERKIPWIHGGVSDFFGQVTTFVPGVTQRFRELFGSVAQTDVPGTSRTIYPPVVTAVASVIASEAFKLASGADGELLIGKLLTIDLRLNSIDWIELAPAR